MAGSQAESVLRHLHQLLKSRGVPSDDGGLLERFVACRDEDAFAELVTRHGPLVYGVCRRVLRDAHDAEDVFQATFLVLARKAASIRKPQSLSCFLHGVAYRLAIKAKAEASKRREHARRATPLREAEEIDLSWREVRALLDEELQRLPEKQRLPLLLCYLEGLTQDEAAQQLGWPRGTLKRRLERGRERLRLRLVYRGVTLGVGLFAVALTESAIEGAVPVVLRNATVRAGVQFTTGAVAVTRAALLAKGALQTMLTTKLKVGAMVMLMLGCVATAAGLVSQQAPSAKQPENKAEAPAQPQPAENKQVRKDRYGDPLPPGAIARLGTVRLRHQSMTASAVFSRDGKTAIVGDGAGNIVYWDVATGREVRRLQGVPGTVYVLAITADGKTLASGGWGQVLLWDVATGKLLSKAQVNNDAIKQMLFTPDGKTLALHYQGDTISLWDIAGSKKLHELKGHTGKISRMALSPDGKTLASGSWADPHVRLWDVATGKEKLHFTTDGRDVLSLAYSPDGKTLAAMSNLAGLAFFDPDTGKSLRKAKYGGLQELEYAPDGKTLLGIEGGPYGHIHVLDAANGKHLRTFEAPKRTMAGLTLSRDGKTAATFWGGAHTFDLWDVASGKLLHPDAGHRHWITSLAFSADGQTVFSAAGFADFTLRVWDARTGEPRFQLGDDSNNGEQRLALAPDGKILAASGYNDNAIRLWDLATRKEVRSFKGHTRGYGIGSLAWSADGKMLVSGSYSDKSIRIWDTDTGKQRRAIEYKAESPCGIALSPDGRVVAAGGYLDGTIHLWAVDTGKELRSIATPHQFVYTLAFSPDGSALASGGISGAIHLWDPATGRLLRRWDTKTKWIPHLAFSTDGRTLLTGHDDHSVRLWEVATGKEQALFAGHRSSIRVVAFARDGRRVASGSDDTTILVWDTTAGARPDSALSAKQLQALWADLSDTDAGRAYRAMWQMALAPKHTLPFLAERLHPVAPLEERQQKQVEHLLADLDNESFTARQRAETELEKMGPLVEPALRKALEGKPSLEVRRRIEKVLEKLMSERLHILRALEALEHVNTPEARKLLESLANGTPRAWLTKEARKSRQRLNE